MSLELTATRTPGQHNAIKETVPPFLAGWETIGGATNSHLIASLSIHLQMILFGHHIEMLRAIQ
jgi:hypothetical protein